MVFFYYPKIYHIHYIIKSLLLWGTNVLCFQHLWFDIGNICADPVCNIWKTFLSFYDMQSDLCFGTSVWFSPVALPAGNVLLIGISLGDWKQPGSLTSAGYKEMLQRNLHIVRIHRGRRCWIISLAPLNHDSSLLGSRLRRGTGTDISGPELSQMLSPDEVIMAK